MHTAAYFVCVDQKCACHGGCTKQAHAKKYSPKPSHIDGASCYLCARHAEVVCSADDFFTFTGQGQRPTPVAHARRVCEIIMLLPSQAAASLRAKWCDVGKQEAQKEAEKCVYSWLFCASWLENVHMMEGVQKRAWICDRLAACISRR